VRLGFLLDRFAAAFPGNALRDELVELVRKSSRNSDGFQSALIDSINFAAMSSSRADTL